MPKYVVDVPTAQLKELKRLGLNEAKAVEYLEAELAKSLEDPNDKTPIKVEVDSKDVRKLNSMRKSLPEISAELLKKKIEELSRP